MWKDAGGEPNGGGLVVLGALISNRKTTEEYKRWFVIILLKKLRNINDFSQVWRFKKNGLAVRL